MSNVFQHSRSLQATWNKVRMGIHLDQTPENLFLARLSAIANLNGEFSEDAEKFLIRTMVPKTDYPFDEKRNFVRSVLRWNEPQILAKIRSEFLRRNSRSQEE